MKIKRRILLISIILFIPFATRFFLFSFQLKNSLLLVYENNQSIEIRDRNNQIIFTKPNPAGYYTEYSNEVPEKFKELLLKKEDQYFYYHFGINPVSSLRALYKYTIKERGNIASSTITQQLAKILLGNETERNLKNKLTEAIYAVSLETHLSKEEILEMYLNSIYFGNSVQGLNQASRLYFDSQPDLLSDEQTIQLLATISAPSNTNPFTISQKLSFQLEAQLLEKFNNYLKNETYFELRSLNIDCENNCNLTIDQELTENLREILKRNLLSLSKKDVSNGAIVVIKLPENELLSIIGSPDSTISSYGYQINMAKETRPIGSTVKPFIYLKGFENDLRPYTLVEDKEYKYTIESGFAFYPKNYDYEYRGEVNLHYALTNSLNVPTVKVLEYAGIDNFNKFLLDDLEFSPIQDIENYQLSIALGGLEMDLLALSYYFTIFPNEGNLLPLKIYNNEKDSESSEDSESESNFTYQTSTNFSQNKKIADQKYIQLINKVLSDRKTGIEQFGMKSNLNLLQDNYAVKTGTSREFCDSWTIGYTPDFLVGVWIGNSDNTPMNGISGQSGAGAIWNEAMNLLINSEYNKKTPFNFNLIQEFYKDNNIGYGLVDDDYEKNKNILENNNLILNPHNGDIFLLEEITQIPLRAREEVEWYVDGQFLGVGKEIIFDVESFGDYEIRAVGENGEEEKIIVSIDIDHSTN
ncbi:MAG: transglycosylase domain-containing protein [Candidatus Pacebacteria bacterium]|nr:transglycosylase domain-containing protein [Candidatus Paceibacterota bacterium]